MSQYGIRLEDVKLLAARHGPVLLPETIAEMHFLAFPCLLHRLVHLLAANNRLSIKRRNGGSPLSHKFLVHRTGDDVGVAVEDITSGEVVQGVYMDTDECTTVTSISDVPLGHKIALVDLDEGAAVIEYGAQIGLVSAPLRTGEHVHTHNIKTARWS